jgi:three-Cys-motif partner protein
MTMTRDTVWKLDPHTLAKHEILRRYLGAWFPILARYNQRIVYIDGFCGPGRYSQGEPGSPLIALEQALLHRNRLDRNAVTFLFLDERTDRIDHLKTELAQMSVPDNFTVIPVSGTFATQFGSLLDRLESQGLQIAPTFAFIDPFGFKGLPFQLTQRLLQNRRTEVFVTVMVDSINRFLDHPDTQVRQHVVELFGTPEALEIAAAGGDRVSNLRMLYQRQLLSCANFVRYFEMRNSRNRTIYYLFFASNHPLGHLRMKEAFWKVDASGQFRFSDATNPDQLVLFELDESPKLATMLLSHFAEQSLAVEKIRVWVEEKTPFLSSHMRAALRLLDSNNEITVAEFKRDGKKRRRNTFPDSAVVEFPSNR